MKRFEEIVRTFIDIETVIVTKEVALYFTRDTTEMKIRYNINEVTRYFIYKHEIYLIYDTYKQNLVLHVVLFFQIPVLSFIQL